MDIRFVSSVVLLLLTATKLEAAETDCNQGCSDYCGTSNADCLLKCQASCESPLVVEDPYFELVQVANLYQDFPLTGCDGHKNRPFRELYCTSLQGRVYKIDIRTNSVHVFHSMPTNRLYTGDGCGLYDIFLDADFFHTSKLYLFHAMADPRPGIHHINAISEYRVINGEMQFQQVIRVFVHRTPNQRAWAKMDMRMHIISGPAPVLVANPGNPYNNRTLHNSNPHLSAIYSFYTNQTDAARQAVFPRTTLDLTWASGIGDPIICARTRYLAENVMCLSKIGEQTLVFNAHRGRDYSCLDEVCEEKIFANLSTGCPVESLVYYTGQGSLKPTRLLSRAACYLDGLWHPSEILKLYEPKYDRLWATVVVRSQPHDAYTHALINTTILSADRYNKLYIAGYSLRHKSYFIYEMKRLKRLY